MTVTVLGIPLGWVGYYVNWIGERHEALANPVVCIRMRGMEEDPQFYRDAITARYMEVAASMEGTLPAEVIARFRSALQDKLDTQFREGFWSKVEREKLVIFIEQLLDRQGTISTDFESLYHRKAELDRKLLGPGDP